MCYMHLTFLTQKWVFRHEFTTVQGEDNLVSWRDSYLFLLEIPDIVLRLSLCLTSVWQLFTDPQGCEVFLVLRGALGCFTQNQKVYFNWC